MALERASRLKLPMNTSLRSNTKALVCSPDLPPRPMSRLRTGLVRAAVHGARRRSRGLRGRATCSRLNLASRWHLWQGAAVAESWFLKVDGIEGGSTSPVHKGEIDIESWSWGLTATSAGGGGGGGGAG